MSKLVLILFFEEVNDELARPEYFGLKDTMHELVVVELLFDELFLAQLLLLIHQWKRRNQYLRIFSHQVVSECHEVNVKSLHFPVHWVGFDYYH